MRDYEYETETERQFFLNEELESYYRRHGYEE